MASLKSMMCVAPSTYAMALQREDGAELQFQFQVINERVPVVVWNEDFEQAVGTLRPPAADLLALVLNFHNTCGNLIPLSDPA